MAAVRENIFVNTTVRDRFLTGVSQLDATDSGIDFNMLRNFVANSGVNLTLQGGNQPLSVYDIFVFWHVFAMRRMLGVGNAAHGGPIFLPWHRMYLLRLEEFIDSALNLDDGEEFGLPYWDWAEDGELPVSMQWRTDLWTADYLGEARGEVRSGPLGDMRVRIRQHPITGALQSIQPRRLLRGAGTDGMAPALPDKDEEARALNETFYDGSPWNMSAPGHRNALEGWGAPWPRLHNAVHVWVNGDMLPGTSPNDPVFFLNHCNVDRLWERWMQNHGRSYLPRQNAGAFLTGHRLQDEMVALIGEVLTPENVLNPDAWYSYDTPLVA